MAIPPIIANNPLLKLFKADQASHSESPSKNIYSQSSQDIIEISNTARQHLKDIKKLSSAHPKEIHHLSVETGRILKENQDITLGLDPDFSA